MASALLPSAVRLVLAALLAVAAVSPLAPTPAAWAAQETSADDDDREIELVSPASARATLRPHRTAVRSAPATDTFPSGESHARQTGPLWNPFVDPLGSRLRC
jgi:hypothetical protein